MFRNKRVIDYYQFPIFYNCLVPQQVLEAHRLNNHHQLHMAFVYHE